MLEDMLAKNANVILQNWLSQFKFDCVVIVHLDSPDIAEVVVRAYPERNVQEALNQIRVGRELQFVHGEEGTFTILGNTKWFEDIVDVSPITRGPVQGIPVIAFGPSGEKVACRIVPGNDPSKR